MKTLVTGAAGFIGASLTERLLGEGHQVVGLDNINTYYDTSLKVGRLTHLGIRQDDIATCRQARSKSHGGFCFIKGDITDRDLIGRLFAQEHFDNVVNLAGQAGVRYSIDNPYAYIESNIFGFLNILEACRHHEVKHLVYASSSSVYGANNKVPYSELDKTDSPVSLYAATKKGNELMAHAYSSLYGIPCTGLRFFTVYGPWGRPDMAPWLFMDAIMHGRPIRVFNNGDMSRDFTYISDIIDGVMLVLDNPPAGTIPARVYNIGHSSPVRLMDFIKVIERVVGRPAIMHMEGMQKGDVTTTYADTTLMRSLFGYQPKVSVEQGIKDFYDWMLGRNA